MIKTNYDDDTTAMTTWYSPGGSRCMQMHGLFPPSRTFWQRPDSCDSTTGPVAAYYVVYIVWSLQVASPLVLSRNYHQLHHHDHRPRKYKRLQASVCETEDRRPTTLIHRRRRCRHRRQFATAPCDCHVNLSAVSTQHIAASLIYTISAKHSMSTAVTKFMDHMIVYTRLFVECKVLDNFQGLCGPRTRTCGLRSRRRTWKLVLEDKDFHWGQQHWYILSVSLHNCISFTSHVYHRFNELQTHDIHISLQHYTRALHRNLCEE